MNRLQGILVHSSMVPLFVSPLLLYWHYAFGSPYFYSFIHNTAMLMASLAFILFVISYRRLPASLLLYFGALLYFAAVVAYDFSFGTKDDELWEKNLPIVVRYFLYLMLGFLTFKPKIEAPKMMYLVLWLVVTLTWLSLVEKFTIPLIPGPEGGGYLYYADMYCLLSFLALRSFTNFSAIFLVGLVSAGILFALGSRSSFVFFIVSMMVGYLYSTWRLLGFVAAGTFFGIILTLGEFYRDLEGNRLVSSLFDLGNDQSLAYRIEGFRRLSNISDSAIFGVYGWQLPNGFGSYLHNFLSYYMQFGAVGLMIMVVFFNSSLKYYFVNRSSIERRAMLAVILFGFLSLMFTRSYSATWFMFSLGVSSHIGSLGNLKRHPEWQQKA
jgi:hypothetical protein